MTEPHADDRPWSVLERVPAVGQVRDAVLFVATAAYVLGYLTWAIYSNDVGLGVLPPLEGQYFLAGAVPLLLLVTAVVALRAIAPLPAAAARQTAKRWSELIVGASVLLILVPPAIGQLVTISTTVALWLLVFGVAGMYFGLALSVRAAETGTGIVLWLLRVSVPLLVAGGIGLCATRLFPLLPRELGGPRPQCVQLDVATAALSPATLALMRVDPTTATARSGPLWLHFEGGGMLVLSERRGRPVPAAFRVRDADIHAVLPGEGCRPS